MGLFDTFVKKSVGVHGNKYDYSKVEYVGSKEKVCIVCPEHGEFWQSPAAHVRGQGCPFCSILKRGSGRCKASEDFIFGSIKTHGLRYNYTKVNYVNARTKVCIICPEHGEFWMLPNAHLRGQGCPKCVGKGMNTDLFIEKAIDVHGNKYDYSKVGYVDSKVKVCIICPEHGEFWQSPAKHLYGRGCPKCGKKSMALKNSMKLSEFIRKSNIIHNNKYCYSNIENLNTLHSKVSIICPKHGEFMQFAFDHLNGHGCPSCACIESRGEREIYEFICSIIGEDKVERRNRSVLFGKELDIFVPEMGVAFEYNGLRWHCEEFGKYGDYHLMKTEQCKERGVKLVQIFEDEYLYHKEIVLNNIRKILLKHKEDNTNEVGVCLIKEVDKEQAKDFLCAYNIQGYGKSTMYWGIYCKHELICLMGFRKINSNDEWEITRFAENFNYICGGFEKIIFNFFIEKYNPTTVRILIDRRWCMEELCDELGFVMDGVLKPDYCYVNIKNPVMRISKLNCEGGDGYSKIWDCGKLRYIWKKK